MYVSFWVKFVTVSREILATKGRAPLNSATPKSTTLYGRDYTDALNTDFGHKNFLNSIKYQPPIDNSRRNPSVHQSFLIVGLVPRLPHRTA